MLDVVDDGVFVYAVGYGLPELLVAEPLELAGVQVRLVGVRVAAGVHVEGEEGGAEGGASTVYGEIAVFLHGIKPGELLAEDAVGIGLSGEEFF